MARHWRDNENRWMHLIGGAFEMDESAKLILIANKLQLARWVV
jgi:hypothetical protein